jgi:hypothetical protein
MAAHEGSQTTLKDIFIRGTDLNMFNRLEHVEVAFNHVLRLNDTVVVPQ